MARKDNTLPGLRAVPPGLDPALAEFLASLKETVELFAGNRGFPEGRFVTLDELERIGLLRTVVKNKRAEAEAVALSTTETVVVSSEGGSEESISEAISMNLADLEDVGAPAPLNRYSLFFNSALGKWIARPATTTDVYLLDTELDAKQPLSDDLTEISDLSTVAFGRSLLELADAGALLTVAGAAPLDSPVFTGVATFPNAGFAIQDTDASHVLALIPGSDLTADRSLTINTGDASRALTIDADTTLQGGTHSGTNTGDQTDVSGNAGTVTIVDAAGDTTCWVLLGTAQTGDMSPATDGAITYNAGTDTLAVTNLAAALAACTGLPLLTGISGITVRTLDQDFSTTSASNTAITGAGAAKALYFTPAANSLYLIIGCIGVRTSNAAVGARPGISWPTSGDDSWGRIFASGGAAATASADRSWGGTTTANVGVTQMPNATDTWPELVVAIIATGASPSGDFQMTLASSSAGTSVTAKKWSSLVVLKLN